ncbi:MAG: helix-turn-helix domain-containing protein [Gammaproteobacteria bacterium]|nr:MAG: helix-turn-helix domain-containing protein [Gammaproteobacteria bacterium]
MSKSKKIIVNRIVTALGIRKTDLAKMFNVSKGAIHSWGVSGIPSEHCRRIESMLADTLDPMTRIDLRPDDWQKWWPELKQDSKKAA